MRRIFPFLLLATVTASAQNTDIEALSGLQFNFGNPGARSLAMGGAFIGLADDASTAEANPAGLTILRKPEVSMEARQTRTAQSLVTGGSYPFVTSTQFGASQNAVSFASAVFPLRRAVAAVYYHRPLAFRSTMDASQRYATPTFYLGSSGLMSADECAAAPDCHMHQIYPFTAAANLQLETFGFAYAREWGRLSIGAAARYHRFEESAATMRRDLDAPGQPIFIVTQTNAARLFAHPHDSDITFVAGVKWAATSALTLGAVYKEGASFPAPVSAGTSAGSMQIVGKTDFHVPTTIGAGVSYRFTPMFLVNADVVRVSYGHLTDKFLSVIEYGTEDGGAIEQLGGYRSRNGTELHVGAEYFLATRIPLALRGGWWRDPAHSIAFEGKLATPHDVAAAILFPRGRDENHYSMGVGLSWPRMQIDAAYDTSRSLKNASISMIVRF